MTLVQGTRRPFEELSSSDTDSPSDTAPFLEDDSPWEISASSDDEESQFKKQPKPLNKCDEFQTPGGCSPRNQQPNQAIDLAQKPNFEVPNLLESIDLVVTCLYKMPIRRSAPLDRLNQKASVDASYYQPFDVRYIKDKFARLDSNVATRLGKMITGRRQLLFSRLSHNQKLQRTEIRQKAAVKVPSDSRPPSQEHEFSGLEATCETSVSEISRSQISSTQYTLDTYATTTKNKTFQFEDTGTIYAPSTAESTSSMASSCSGENMRVEVPPRPKGKDGKELDRFKCPYCLVTQSIETKHAWK